jgi:hypothetical protein
LLLLDDDLEKLYPEFNGLLKKTVITTPRLLIDELLCT